MSDDDLGELLRWKKIRDRIDRLRTLLAKSDEHVVPWVGAGLSFDYGFRLWRDFVKSAADIVLDPGPEYQSALALIGEGKYDAATDVIDDAKSLAFRRYLYDEFLSVPPLNVPHCVAKLLTRVVVTTNYDRVLETAMPWRVPLNHKNYDIRVFHEGSCIVKLHGSIEDKASWVLTSRQYKDAYVGPIKDLLQTLMTHHHLLFVGCSLQVDKYLEVLDGIPPGNRLDHYALLSCTSAKDDAEVGRRCDKLENRGILAIPYRRSRKHAIVKEILGHLSPTMDVAIQRATDEVSADSPDRRLYVLTPWIAEPPSDKKGRRALGRALGRIAQRLRRSTKPHVRELGLRYLRHAQEFAPADRLVSKVAREWSNRTD